MKYIKRKSAVKPITGSIVDTTNIDDKTTNTYSANTIDELVKDVYSTTEQVVGTWIDGRPIYRKVLIGTLPSVGQNTFIDIDDYMKEIIKAYSYFYTSANQHVPLPYINSSKQRIVANSYQKQWAFVNEIDTNAGLPCGVIIEYTKTTDKANVMINFTVNCSATNIGNKTYQAEYGMTWREWINSEYNVDGYYLEADGYVRLNATYYIAYPNTSTDVIQSGMSYETVKGK